MLAFLPLVIPFIVKNWKAVLIGVAVLIITMAALYERSVLIAEGEADAKAKIDQANQEEMRRANEAQDTVDGCYAIGGDWDRARGVCVGPAGK